jgi:hypothetical protein
MDEFQAAAAHIANQSGRAGLKRHDAKARQPSFFRARDDLDRKSEAFNGSDELSAIARIAHCGGRNDAGWRIAMLIQQPPESRKNSKRAINRCGVQETDILNVSSEAAKRLLIADRKRRPHRAFIDDEANRIGSDVNHGLATISLRAERSAVQLFVLQIRHARWINRYLRRFKGLGAL